MGGSRSFVRSGFLAFLVLAGMGMAARADESVWQARMDAAERAEREGRSEDAEAFLLAAVREAGRPGSVLLMARSLEAQADFYERAGRTTEAEPLYVQSVEIWERVLGDGQPRVGIPLHNLAVLRLKQCRVEEALPLIRRVLDLWRETLGPAHPDRLTAIRTEATLLRRCGRADEAEKVDAQAPP